MSNGSPETTAGNSRPTPTAAPVIRVTTLPDARPGTGVLTRQLPAWIVSGVIHVLILCLFLFVGTSAGPAEVKRDTTVIQTEVEKDEPEKVNLENPDIGFDPSELLNYNVNRIDDNSVPGMVNPSEAVGIKDAPDGAATNVPPPPGLGTNLGQGGGLDAAVPGKGNLVGFAGGMGGLFVPGGFGGRSGATREKMVTEGGGNTASEAAVAKGLDWFVRHQAPDGHWSLDGFNHQKGCNCTGTGQSNDIAGTAFGLLPFLGAGQTHKPTKDTPSKYAKQIQAALDFLVRKQNREGFFGGNMYGHGLATIAVCEAYGLTQDPRLKGPAQRAINFIRAAQSEGGGWRYEPRQGGDTSVVGWQVMALKSGQMAGLEVDDPRNPTLTKATKFLNSVQTADGGGYGYTDASEPTVTRSAVGLLCRQYLGWGPRNPGLIVGVSRLKERAPPGATKNMYYYYYATQVMHHMGGEAWEFWNPKMRDLLVKTQDQGNTPKHEHQKGSWAPQGDAFAGAGGRVMITSLSLLTLEVYYRHLPLYRRDMGARAMGAN
jgi:hypothetical protein